MTVYPSRRKILWFLFKTLFKVYFTSTSTGKCDFSLSITDEQGNYQYLSYKEGNTWHELRGNKYRE